MTDYYVVGNVNGPISTLVEAADAAEVQRRFDAGEFDEAADRCDTDAEDDLDIVGEGMTAAQFDAALIEAGCRMVRALDQGARANADGWYLWAR